jgi:hypothetical protein
MPDYDPDDWASVEALEAIDKALGGRYCHPFNRWAMFYKLRLAYESNGWKMPYFEVAVNCDDALFTSDSTTGPPGQ